MTQYIDFVNDNIEEISNLVTKNIENSRNDFKKFTLVKIKECLNPVPTHYKWQLNDCPWDHSGELIKDGQVNLNQSIYDFLNNEYTGNSRASYLSGMGLFYDTYGDYISYDTSNFAYGIMFSTIKEFIEEHFSVKLTDKQIDDIRFDCNDFDDIYDNSITNLFFTWEYAIEFLDIGQLQLIEILNDENLGR